jgi:hypothetical protein
LIPFAEQQHTRAESSFALGTTFNFDILSTTSVAAKDMIKHSIIIAFPTYFVPVEQLNSQIAKARQVSIHPQIQKIQELRLVNY